MHKLQEFTQYCSIVKLVIWIDAQQSGNLHIMTYIFCLDFMNFEVHEYSVVWDCIECVNCDI